MIEQDRLALRLASGNVKRWHTIAIHGEQTVADHTYRMVQILRYIEPFHSLELLHAALDHDAAESRTGDIPFRAKTDDAVKVEAEILKEHDMLYELSVREEQLLKAADLLEMGFFAMSQIELGNSEMKYVLGNVWGALLPLRNLTSRTKELVGEIEEYVGK